MAEDDGDTEEKPKPAEPIATRSLGDTGVELSEITLGTWGLAAQTYGEVSAERFEEVVAHALEIGVRSFDVSGLWGEDGASERVVARATKERRDEVRYVTRVGARVVDGVLVRDCSAERVVEDCEAALERLRTDRIDVLLLGDPSEEEWKKDELTAAMKKLVDDGKVLAWGASVGDVEKARMAISAGAKALCMPYNLLWSDEVHDLSGELSVAKCGVLARSPLAYGLLAGRWSESRTFPEHDHRRDRWHASSLRARVRQVNRLRFLVHGQVHSMAAAAIRYVLANSVVTSALVGARSVPQITQAAQCAGNKPYLPDDDMVRLPQVLAAAGV